MFPAVGFVMCNPHIMYYLQWNVVLVLLATTCGYQKALRRRAMAEVGTPFVTFDELRVLLDISNCLAKWPE